MGRSLDLDDELDALLDAARTGALVGRHPELAPLVEVAAALRAELSCVQLDPVVASQHVRRAVGAPRIAPAGPSLNGVSRRIGTEVPAPQVPSPATRPARFSVRRRLTMVALAAALVLVPATMAAGGALPGQPLYPVKRSVEQVRLAALGWSPAASARERLRLADVRTDELAQLVERGEVGHVPGAVVALRQAVDAATEAVDQASFKDVGSSRSVALRQDLASVQDHQIIQLSSVTAKLPSSSSPAARQAREAANNALVSATRQKAAQTGGGRTATTTTGAPAATPTTGALLPGLATTVTVTTVAAAGAAQAGAATAAGPTAAPACGDSPGSSGAPAAARVSSGGPSAPC